MTADAAHRVVVVGGGFGGLAATRSLRGAPAAVTLIDRANHHLFQPLLYQVATGILAEGEISPPLRGILRRQRNARVMLAEVTGFDLDARTVSATAFEGEATTVPYDTLVVAAGARHSYFGNPGWESFAPGLKSIADTRRIKARVLGAFEAAAECTDPRERAAHLTFVVVGAGPTGLELTGQLAELARHTLRRDFRAIDTATARIVLVDAGTAVLAPFAAELQRYAARDLAEMGVEVRLRTTATGVDADGVDLRGADGTTERIAAGTVLWAAGVRASPLASTLGEASGAEVDRAGRVAVEPDCTLPGHSNVFAIGDMVALDDLPGLAQPALQEGRYVAKAILARLRGAPAPPPFRYRDKGTMAVIGRRRAIVDAGRLKLRGEPAMLVWAGVHIAFLVGWGNRLGTIARWLGALLGRRRGERAIDARYTAR